MWISSVCISSTPPEQPLRFLPEQIRCSSVGDRDYHQGEVHETGCVATLLMLISPVGGGIIPSFTRNWLTKNRADVGPPHPESRLDRAVLGLTVLALFAVAPDAVVTARSTIIAGS